jgi:hypothetical protein
LRDSASTLHVVHEHRRPRDPKVRLVAVKRLFELMKDQA